MEKQSSNDIFDSYFSNVKSHLDQIDTIRRLGIKADIDLPSIVVIGDQSSGKSSILEAISGLQLPKGTGMVTRCPLIIQCRNNEEENRYLAYSKNGKEENIPLHDSLLQETIKNAQTNMIGQSKNISSNEITLHIESAVSPNLTLIDLPGIARCNLDDPSSKSSDIYQQTISLISKYISSRLTVILCVIQADLDLATSEVLTLAKKFDPNYERTMGILTKPDMVPLNSRTEICKTVRNEGYHLGLGYHIVRCRTYDELVKNVSLTEVAGKADKLFTKDPHYNSLPEEMKGVDSLKASLTKHLFNLIKKTLPNLKSKINQELTAKRKEREKLPIALTTDDMKEQCLFNLRLDFLTNVDKILSTGERLDGGLENQDYLNERSVFSIWRGIFDGFLDDLKYKTNTNLRKELDPKTLEKLIESQRGRSLQGFQNYSLFEKLIRDHIATYQEPAVNCMTQILTNLTELVDKEIDNTFLCFPSLRDYIQNIGQECCSDQKKRCEIQLKFLFEMENLVFTQDEFFNDACKSLGSPDLSISGDVSKDALNFHELIRSYLKLINQRLGDSIPNCIRVCLHREFYRLLKTNLSPSTTTNLANSTRLVDLLVESDEVTKLRDSLCNTIKTLEHALETFQV